MTNRILFSIIGLLAIGVLGIGGAIAFGNKGENEDEEELSNVESVATTTPEKAPLASSGTTALNSKEDCLSAPSGKNDDDDEGEREDEDEGEEDEDGDDNSSAKSPCPPASSGTLAQTSGSGSQPKPQPSPAPTGTAKTYTLAEVSAHNSAASCWSAINGSVYDLTPFVSKHPGGQAAIKSLCGVDGTAAFNNQHGGATKPESQLAKLRLGVLAK